MANGRIKFFDPAKGWGFITPDQGGPDVFLHADVLHKCGIANVVEGLRVEYEAIHNRRGWRCTRLDVDVG